MSRIRSVHPGLFTDEAFMAASAHARMLMIGLWCEADDQGVFEWKPLTLKARLLPADTVNVSELLDELAGLNVIQRFEADGKALGAIRNFRRFQRPQKPNAIHPLPEVMRAYVGLSDTPKQSVSDQSRTATVPVADQSRTGSGKSQPMEDEGGRREEKGKGEPTRTVQDDDPASGADGADRHPEGKYEFVSGVIRLNRRDFEDWQRDYPNLNLRAELRALAQWAADQGKWWMPVQAALAKRDREARLAVERIKADAVAAAGRPKPVARAYVC